MVSFASSDVWVALAPGSHTNGSVLDCQRKKLFAAESLQRLERERCERRALAPERGWERKEIPKLKNPRRVEGLTNQR